MKCLLIGGAERTGKTSAINRLTDLLINQKGFYVVSGKRKDTNNGEVRAVIKGKDKNGNLIKILINSASDTPRVIEDLKNFMDLYPDFDVLISSVRDLGSWPRWEFFNITGIDENSDDCIEFPLAKITRRKKKFLTALNWYNDRIDSLIKIIITNKPFDLLK